MGYSKKMNAKINAFKLFEKNKLTQKQISKHLKVTEKTVGNWKKEFNAYKIFKTEKFDLQQMAEQFNVSYTTVLNWQNEFDIMNYEQEEEVNSLYYLQAIQKELTEIKALIRQKGS